EPGLEDEIVRFRVERGGVVERHAGAQLERVGEAVLRDVPRLGQARHELVAAELLADESLEDPLGHAGRVQIGDLRRVHGHGLGGGSDGDGGLLRGGRGGGGGGGGGGGSNEEGAAGGRGGPPRRGGY